LENSIEYAVSYFGIIYCGKTVLPLNTCLKDQEYLNLLSITNVDLIISSEKYRKRLKNTFKNSNLSIIAFFVDSEKYIKFGRNKNSSVSCNDNSLNDVGMLLVTSGSTGNAKIVMLTHKNLISNVFASCISGGITSNDTTLIFLPMCFGFCNTAQFLSHLMVGGKIVISDKTFHPHVMKKLVKKYGVTNVAAVPSMMILLVSSIPMFPAIRPTQIVFPRKATLTARLGSLDWSIF